MFTQQHTINKTFSFSGSCLHTGLYARVRVLPAPIDYGIQFKRIDLEGQPTIPAHIDKVVDTTRCTVIGEGEARISTIEHLMSAFAGTQVDNALVEIDNEEVPILDGSAAEMTKLIKETGLEEQSAKRQFLVFQEAFSYLDDENNMEIRIIPADTFSATVMLDYDSSPFNQHHYLHSIEEYEDDISHARTFCLLSELPFFG